MEFTFNDGGRKEAGYKGDAGDCVVRAIAIATEQPYQLVYDELFKRNEEYASTHWGRKAQRIQGKGASPREGNFREVYQPYLEELGWRWNPTMAIGSGCQVHLKADELPSGTIIVKVSKHLVTVANGVIQDTYDCSRQGTRCVYGYYVKTV